ncbi:AMP-binding protein [Micrococcus porci]|uniref:AMP-binding protein n=1 Tax=Micrococcus porci TaxID=2856555 RepID=UPI003CF2483C
MSPLAPVPDPAARLAFLADADHAAVLAEAVGVRAGGGVPVVGDERWPADLRAAQREHAVVQLRRLAERDPDLAARVGWAAFTSGSTSRPRVVLRTDDSWQAGHPHVAAWLGLAPGEAMLTAVHPVSSMALHAAAWCATAGHRLAVSPHARLTATDLIGPAALNATPSQLTDALDLLDDGAPSTLRVALVGGDRLPPVPAGSGRMVV